MWDQRADRGGPRDRARLPSPKPARAVQIQAAINAVHADARSIDTTDWTQILALYDQLLAMTPTPVVAMNRAIALGEVRGPQAALDILDGLELGEYHLFHAARADLLRRLGRHDEASQAYARAATWLLATPSEASSWPASKRSREPDDGRLDTAQGWSRLSVRVDPAT